MSSNKENVQTWRKRTKERIVQAFGSKCACCQYNTCIEALQFHHLDPNQKEIGISMLTANIKSWSTIVAELRKCVMLCANCHVEVHRGLRVIPCDAPRFDESFAEYKKTSFGHLDSCPVCGKDKPSNQKTCSRSCGASSTKKVEWNVQEAIDRMKTESISQIAASMGISGGTITKKLKKLGLK